MKEKIRIDCSLKDLIAICSVINLEFFTDTEKYCNIILKNLSDLSQMQTEEYDFSENDDLEPADFLNDSQLKRYGKKKPLETQNENRRSPSLIKDSDENVEQTNSK
ncbi:hypothetical protein TNCT_732661 [Trichonephila clavata]|uniref:Uncharacterized protein n=1 Tax=Trichonephila clavata TaxID=2740835 RepID=A0A8X6IKP3_TRICU|nr:hypothetical protein TNCT_732661 [Trichonephila clavata]